MSFDIDVTLSLGERTIALSCRTGPGVTVITGPSGIGKTSILNMVAGLLRPDRGHIRVDGRTIFDRAAGIDLPAAQRGIGYVFQDRRLFPHMRVRANLLYGRRAGAGRTIEDIVATLGIGHLLDRWPHSLSGGEMQRVAIGRALLSSPECLLLDEPLSWLDIGRRKEIGQMIDQVCADTAIPTLYVTHDLIEAGRLSAHIVSMTDRS